MALVKKKVSKTKNLVMGSIAAAVIIVTLVLVYMMILKPVGIEEFEEGVTGDMLTAPVAQINTKFNTDVLDDGRLRSLKLFGPEIIRVTERGRKANPFQPF